MIKKALLAVLILAAGLWLASTIRNTAVENNSPSIADDSVSEIRNQDRGKSIDESKDDSVQIQDEEDWLSSATDLSDIAWRTREYRGPDTYPNNYDGLRAAAESGDANAALVLANTLQLCDRSGPPPQSDEEFAEDLRLIREQFKMPRYGGGRRTEVDLGDMSIDKAIFAATFFRDRCQGFPVERRRETTKWLELASAGGNLSAQSWLLGAASDATVAEEHWSAGEPLALLNLAHYNDKQYASGADPAGRIRSIAYRMAYVRLQDASKETTPGPHYPVVSAEEGLRGQVATLLPGQLREAQQLADQILQERRNCCVSLHYSRN